MPIYEYQCRTCNHTWSAYSSLPHDRMNESCPKCLETGDRLYSLSNVKVFEVFETRNILPGGVPVTVKGSGQLRQLEAEHGVKRVDGPPPQTEF